MSARASSWERGASSERELLASPAMRRFPSVELLAGGSRAAQTRSAASRAPSARSRSRSAAASARTFFMASS